MLEVFGNVIGHEIERIYWVGVDPKSDDWCLYKKREIWTQKHREETRRGRVKAL